MRSGPRLAVFTKNRTNPAYQGARLGAERAAAERGASVVHYVPREPDDVTEQIALVDAALATRPDAFVFVPVHETAVGGALARIEAAGIPVATLISRAAAGSPLTFVGSDDYALALELGRRVGRHLGGRGEVVVVEGSAASPTSAPRTRGFLDAIAEYRGMHVAGRVRGDYQQSVAETALDAWLATRADGGRALAAVVCANDVMALGAMTVLRRRGLRAAITGVNALPEAVAAIRAGDMLASADFDATKMAYIATQAALRHLRGEAVPPEILLPVEIVDRENFAAWDAPLGRRPLPQWKEVVAPAAPPLAGEASGGP